jgi:1,2-diacylglycerol 3-alpha-glucosyltransferase
MIKRTAIVYHFFPHYRKAVMLELLQLKTPEVTLVGDRDSSAHDSSIAAWVPDDQNRFIATRSFVWRKLVWQSGVLSVAASSRYDTIVFLASLNFISTWIGAIVARLRGKRVLFWAHGWTTPDRGLKGFIRRLYYSFAQDLLLYGRRARSIGIAKGIRPEHLHVVYNSLDYPAQCKARSKLSTHDRVTMRRQLFGSEHGAVVACITRLTALRRLDLLLDAVATLRRSSDRQIAILLIGEGPERKELEEQAKNLGLRIHFTGSCYDEWQIARYLWCATCTVAPGKVGLTAMHSFAFGVPVLTHDLESDQMPESEAVVDGVTGEHFRHGDVADLARVIEKWTTTDHPLPSVSAACFQVLERFFNPTTQVDLIRAALDGKPARDEQGEALRADELAPDPHHANGPHRAPFFS